MEYAKISIYEIIVMIDRINNQVVRSQVFGQIRDQVSDQEVLNQMKGLVWSQVFEQMGTGVGEQ